MNRRGNKSTRRSRIFERSSNACDHLKNDENQVLSRHDAISYNKLIKRMAAGRANVRLIDVDLFVYSADEIDGIDHFSRIVYFRIFQAILGAVKGDVSDMVL